MRKTSNGRFAWLIPPLLIFILLRVALLIILYKLTGGNEFTSDTFVFNLGLHPLSVLTFASDASLYSQPPLFPIAISPLVLILSAMTNEFLAPRLCYTLIELCMFLVMAVYVARADEFELKSRRAIMTILAISPLGFMTGTVMCQEEAIVALFTAILLLVVRNGRYRLACLIVILGILTGKILFGIAFVGLLFVARNKRRIIYFGILPVMIILSLYSLLGYRITGAIPFLSFSPTGIPFCSSVFNLLLYLVPMSGPFMKWASLTILVVSFAILWLFLKRTDSDDFPVVQLVVFCALFFIFYHMNAEYYIFALPLLAIVPYLRHFKFSKAAFNWLHFIFGITSWGYAITYGIRVYSKGFAPRSNSKELALSVYNKFLGFLPIESVEIFLLSATLLIIIVLAAISFRHLRRRQLSSVV